MISLARVKHLMAAAFAFLLILASAAGAQTLRIYHIDVEQGDSTLFVSPGGNTMLVDSGKNGHGSRIKAVMDSAGVTKIDYLVTTHYHEDHYGGIDELVENKGVTVTHAYDRGDKAFIPQSKLNGSTYKGYDRAAGSGAEQLTRGETVPLDPSLTVTCISAGGVVLSEEDSIPGTDENDMSISLLVTYGGFRYFIGGDIEAATESKIAHRDLVKDVDVYQADHHGSDTSSSLAFMQDLKPSVIIISNGNNATYKHPRQVTLDAYAGLNPPPAVFQTNKYLQGGAGGNVPDEFIGDLESSDTDGTVLVTVNGSAGSYTVSYRGLTHTYYVKASPVSAVVVIESLLPDPEGPEREMEEVTLRNKDSSQADMTGWTIRDRSGRIWTLGSLGTLSPGQSAAILRHGMPMSLNNAGDEITLLDPNGQQADQFAYTDSQEGVLIQTGH